MAEQPLDTSESCGASCVSRRLFMTASGVATTTLLLGDVFPGKVLGQDAAATVEVTKLPRKQIAQLSKLVDGQPVSFNYPGDGNLANCLIVKTGETSGGGVGDAQDIVAFSARCTHMGGDLNGLYNAEHKSCRSVR